MAVAVTIAGTLLFLTLAQGGIGPHARLDAQQLPASSASAAPQGIRAQSAVMASPQPLDSAFMTTPQLLTPTQLNLALLDMDKFSSTWAGRRAGVVTANPAAGPEPGTEVQPNPAPSSASGNPAARFLTNIGSLDPAVYGLAVRMIAEPSIAVGGSDVWFTGNWFAARSTDSGATWSYVNPYADFPTFSSDQDAVFDPHRRLFMWYRQGRVLPGRLENSVKLSVSSDGAASWCSYTLHPTDVDPSWSTFQFDYPHLALTDNYLYVSSTLLVTGSGYATPRMILLRLPLDNLANCGGFRYSYWTTDEGYSWAPVENGATDVMYLGDTLEPGGTSATGIFRVYVQPEWSTTLIYVDRAVPAWTFTERTGRCPVLGGGNPCARGDQRITAGWVRQHDGRGEVGFLWDVREGGGFPYPYIDAATFDQETLTVTGRPMLWDSKCAWQYGAAAPNGEGLGVAAFHFCPSQPPAHAVGLGERSGGQPAWTMYYSRIGDVATTTEVWGDYIRMRADGSGYAATGYTIGPNGAAPFLVSFGRAPGVR